VVAIALPASRSPHGYPRSHQASKAEIAVLVELPQMPHQPTASGYFVHEQYVAEVG